jgi:hypothetical protein
MRYPITTRKIERNDNPSDIDLYQGFSASTLQLQLEQVEYMSSSLYESNSKQYVISHFEVRESEI